MNKNQCVHHMGGDKCRTSIGICHYRKIRISLRTLILLVKGKTPIYKCSVGGYSQTSMRQESK